MSINVTPQQARDFRQKLLETGADQSVRKIIDSLLEHPPEAYKHENEIRELVHDVRSFKAQEALAYASGLGDRIGMGLAVIDTAADRSDMSHIKGGELCRAMHFSADIHADSYDGMNGPIIGNFYLSLLYAKAMLKPELFPDSLNESLVLLGLPELPEFIEDGEWDRDTIIRYEKFIKSQCYGGAPVFETMLS